MWALGWVADYPGRNDFLGVLLGTGATNNYGHWSSPTFDAAIAEADLRRPTRRGVGRLRPRGSRSSATRSRSSRWSYGPGWALSRTGLLGAGQNGLGIVRMAGLAWAN